jgi:hypothetical protein
MEGYPFFNSLPWQLLVVMVSAGSLVLAAKLHFEDADSAAAGPV